MLTGDLVRPRLSNVGGKLKIDLLDAEHPRWQHTAADLIALMQQHVGQPQQAWEGALAHYEGDRIDYTVVRGLAKVLSDAATFTPLVTSISPTDLRAYLFQQGPAFERPDLFFPQTRDDIIRDTGQHFGLTAEQVETLLYADRSAAAILNDPGPVWTPYDLIARYNLELARAALYWCDGMTIEIYDTFKTFWRYLKLFKLMFWANPLEAGGYQVALDGPISPFVQSTTRYGRQFAAFLPALFLCEHWSMRAMVRPPNIGTRLIYELDNHTPFRSHFKRGAAFDSQMEADFAAEFRAKFGDERAKWELTREDEVLLLGDTVMIPDFALTHRQDGRRALIEIVGFWHPDYLRRKLEKVRAAKRSNLILLIYEGVNLAQERLKDIPAQVLYFQNKPVLKQVMEMIEKVAE
ncbi:MAG: DUF790 family protein [Anaerolineae bacterium]|nr:DUF790 family protein [Anaerolineae bacterium]